ncbi:DUF6077 domain-containing protein [Turicibacter bilis]|uniref:DUF6077 domain-containing protein n=1 Tax=Turicibacter bilis TaxID=2735723 RepID=UPI0031BA7997
MLSLLLLIILFVLYSQLVGQAAYSYFPEILGKIKYKWPIGFFIILGLIQLVSFPLQAMHVSMQVVAICYALIFLILSIFVFRYLYAAYCDKRLEIFKFEKAHLMEYLLILLFIGFNFIICFSTNSFNDTNADQSFYITLVENNVGAEQINGILPLSGQIGWLDSYYNFQGFYLFLTFLSMIFNLDAVLVMAWFVPILLWLTVSMTFLNLIYYFNRSNKSWKTISIFIILWSFVSLFDYFVRYNVYGNNIRLFVFAYLMMAYADYFKSSKLRTLILCGLLWASAISFQSTALFLGIMIMVAIGIYELFYHRKELILPLIFSSMPLLVYAAFFLSYRSTALLGVVIGGGVTLLAILSCNQQMKLVLNRLFYSRFFRGGIILGVIGMTVLSMKMVPSLNEEVSISPRYFIEFLFDKYAPRRSYIAEKNWSMLSLALIRDSLFLLYLVALVQFKKLNETLKFTLIIQWIIILIFYNPLVSAFVSTYFTGSVYMRTGDIIMSLFLISGLLVYFVNHSKLRGIVIILACLSAIQLTAKTHQYLTHDFNQITNTQTFNHLYRMDQDIIDTANYIEAFVEEHYSGERPKVLTTQLELNYFAHNYEMLYTVNEERRVFNDSYRQAKPELYLLRDGLRKSYELSEEQQQQFKETLEQLKPDIVVIPTIAAPWVHEIFDNVTYKINENDSCIVYQLLK